METRRNFLFNAIMQMISFVLFGCSTSRLKIRNANFPNNPKGKGEINLLLEPHMASCMEVTEGMRSGEVTVIRVVFPRILLGEWIPDPPRIRWFGWAVSEDGKQEFPVQAIIHNLSKGGLFLATLIIEGKGPALKSAKCVLLSTMLNFVYDLLREEESPLDWKKFVKNTNGYRVSTVLEKGTRIGDFREASGFFTFVKEQWTRYEERGGKRVFYSPLTEAMMKKVLAINPRYSWSQNLVGSARISISIPPNPPADLLNNALNVYEMHKLLPAGWDYRSELPSRRDMALIIRFVTELYARLVQSLNRELLELKLEGGKE